jgi:HEAT repeat protein
MAAPVDAGLLAIVPGLSRGWLLRGRAAALLLEAGDRRGADALLRLFFDQQDKIELWETALAIETTQDVRAVRPLVAALHDANPHRRHAAARALGWIHAPGKQASHALADASQPPPVREEAAESLSYARSPAAVPVLVAASSEPDVRIRFWSCFALGSYLSDPRAVSALEARLSDDEIAPGNWWAVRREALAMLGGERLDAEIRRVDQDPNASPEDRRWADAYRRPAS